VRCLLGSMALIGPALAAAQTLPSSDVPSTMPSAPQDPKITLQSPDVSQPDRDISATRYIAWRDPAVVPAVVDFLTNGTPPVKIAMSRAIASVGWANDQFVDPLIAVLKGREPVPAAAAAAALALYSDNQQVMDELIAQAKSERADIRQPAIRALGSFSQKTVAENLVGFLHEKGPVREAAADALIQMTGQSDLDHDSLRWDKWLAQNDPLSDADFHDLIIRLRGNAFESEVAQHRALQNAVAGPDGFLRSDFWSAPRENRAAILLAYMQSSAPEIRELAAELVYSSATTTGAPPGAIQQTRLLLGDPSPAVRAAAAVALSTDVDSISALVAQLKVETDDLVRVRLINSLAPFHDINAIGQMLILVGKNYPDSVRIAAADGIREGSDIVNANPTTKSQAIQILRDALQGTDAPGEEALREAIVGALASIHDDSLSDLFRSLLSGNETIDVRASALVGLGNLPNSAAFAQEIGHHLSDDDYEMRLAAIQALRNPPSPIPSGYITEMLRVMNNDPDDPVRTAAWDDLQYWSQLPNIDESGLAALVDGLKSDPVKQLPILQKLCDRLGQAIQQGNTPAPGEAPFPEELAAQQQNLGDLMMNSAVNRPMQAADQYKAALAYWQANHGDGRTINRLCRDITDALLAAKHWDDACHFASDIITKYGNDPNLMITTQTVGSEFISTLQSLRDSSDPDSYSDATALMDAIGKMNPQLSSDFTDQITYLRTTIEAKHRAGAQGP